MPSAAGKRVGRVLAGCSKPEAGDKPGLLYLTSDLRDEITCIGHHHDALVTDIDTQLGIIDTNSSMHTKVTLCTLPEQ